MTSSEAGTNRSDDSHVTRQQWYWTVLAAMASYLDAGSIVAVAAGLALWAEYLSLSTTTLGLLAALGPNAIGAAVGAVVGGRLGDLLGRKRIYQYDLLLYAFGTLWMVFAFNTPMLIIGTILVGIAVGADVPTSLALVGELAPSKARSKLMGLTQVAWSLGPIITLVLALVLAPYGLLGIRIVFFHLFVVAMVTWWLRQGLTESATWTSASGAGERTSGSGEQASEPRDPLAMRNLRNLFTGYTLKAMVFTAVVYTFWNLAAGTYGFFLPYFLSTVGANTQGGSVALQCLWFTTMLRTTAQGVTFAVARTCLGIWSFFVPTIAAAGFEGVALILAIFLTISGVVGFLFMPNTAGKSLEEIEAENYGEPRAVGASESRA